MSADSLLFRRLSKDKETLEEKATAQVQDARSALDQHHTTQGLALLQDVLTAFPDQRDAKALSEQARDAKHPKAVAKPTAWSEAVSHFSSGDLAGAEASAKGCASKAPRCRELVQEIKEFGELKRHVDSLDNDQLARMKELEHSISEGHGSSLGNAASEKQATAFYRKAMDAKGRGDLGGAATFAKRALSADPGHKGAKALLSDLQGMAKQVFLEGYAEKDTDAADAIKHFKDVLNMTAPDDEYHGKAERWIEKLRQ